MEERFDGLARIFDLMEVVIVYSSAASGWLWPPLSRILAPLPLNAWGRGHGGPTAKFILGPADV